MVENVQPVIDVGIKPSTDDYTTFGGRPTDNKVALNNDISFGFQQNQFNSSSKLADDDLAFQEILNESPKINSFSPKNLKLT